MKHQKIKYFEIPYFLQEYETHNLRLIENLNKQALKGINAFYKQLFQQIEEQKQNYDLLQEVELDIQQVKHNICLLMSENTSWKFDQIYLKAGYVKSICNVYLDDIIYNQANTKKQLSQKESVLSKFQLRLVRLKSKTRDPDQRCGSFLLMHFLSIEELQNQENRQCLDTSNQISQTSFQILRKEEIQVNQNQNQQINRQLVEKRNSLQQQVKQQDKKNGKVEKQLYQSRRNSFEISQQNDQIEIQQNYGLNEIMNLIQQFHTNIQQRKKQKIHNDQRYSANYIQQGIEEIINDIDELQEKYQKQSSKNQQQTNQIYQNIISHQKQKQLISLNPQQSTGHSQKQLFHSYHIQDTQQNNNKQPQIIDLTSSEEMEVEEENQNIRNHVQFNQSILLQNIPSAVNSTVQSKSQMPEKQVQQLDLENKYLRNQLKDAEYEICQKNIKEAKLKYEIFLLKNPNYKPKNEEDNQNDYLVVE
ncbi:hypothetical protein ABPG72_013409 [Tetrahymena utriculariae]